MTSRFDYVQYDDLAKQKQDLLKNQFMALETTLSVLKPSRPQSLVLTKLEEAYMWIGKAIRDDQIARNAPTPLQEGRTNG